MRTPAWLIAFIFIATTQTPTRAQSPKPLENNLTTALPCLSAREVSHAHLLGLWRASFEGKAPAATVLLETSREHADSYSGGVNRQGRQSLVAGDLDDGQFTLEESEDGQRISATWLGEVVEGQCGREIRGTWTPADGSQVLNFVLRKQPSWR